MSESPESSEPSTRRTAVSWSEHWNRVGPKLQAIRRRELRNFDFDRERVAIDALLEIAVAHAVPRTTSGLVTLQKRLRKLYS